MTFIPSVWSPSRKCEFVVWSRKEKSLVWAAIQPEIKRARVDVNDLTKCEVYRVKWVNDEEFVWVSFDTPEEGWSIEWS